MVLFVVFAIDIIFFIIHIISILHLASLKFQNILKKVPSGREEMFEANKGSNLIIGLFFYKSTRMVPLIVQEMLSFPEYPSSFWFFVGFVLLNLLFSV
jgi:hypothetical protein